MMITNQKTLYLSEEEIKESIVDYILNKIGDERLSRYLDKSYTNITSGGPEGMFAVTIIDTRESTIKSKKEDSYTTEEDIDLYEYGGD